MGQSESCSLEGLGTLSKEPPWGWSIINMYIRDRPIILDWVFVPTTMMQALQSDIIKELVGVRYVFAKNLTFNELFSW